MKGRSLGVIGLGFVAKKVCTVGMALGMTVFAYDPYAQPMDNVTILGSTDELAAQCDIISIHCPSLPVTKGMINADFLGKMKPDGVFINSARGDLVNEEDMAAHLEANEGFWFGADVWQGEPSSTTAEFDHALAKHPRVVGTHHIGASTLQAEAEIGEEAVRVLGVF